MSNPTKQQVKSAKLMLEGLEPDLYEHEHNDNCIEPRTVEITYFVTPDIDRSYEQEAYFCSVTNEAIEVDDQPK